MTTATATHRTTQVENLRWITHRDNMRAAIERRGNWFAGVPKYKVPILRINPEDGAEVRYESVLAACVELNRMTVANGGIAKVPNLYAGNVCHARNRVKLAYGFYWCSPRKRLALAILRAKVSTK